MLSFGQNENTRTRGSGFVALLRQKADHSRFGITPTVGGSDWTVTLTVTCAGSGRSRGHVGHLTGKTNGLTPFELWSQIPHDFENFFPGSFFLFLKFCF